MARILVCGDAMTDTYWYGGVNRISPEAPVPVVKMDRMEDRPGAAANVAANCEAMGVPCERVFSPSKDAVVKIRVIGKCQQVVRIDFDRPQDPVSYSEFMKKLPNCEVVIFSDYGKGSLKEIQTLIHNAKVAGKTILVDPKGHDYKRYCRADVVKPNRDEMKDMVGGWGSEEELAEKAERLRKESGVGAILLTRAEHGMTLFTEGGAVQIPSKAQEVFDVSGAGDTAIAALAVALTRGHTLEEAAHFANIAAGCAVARFGTAVVTAEEVFRDRIQ